MTTNDSVNATSYHICIAGQGGLPMIDPVWVSPTQASYDPATSNPLPFITGIDVSREHEVRIFNDKNLCIQTFDFGVDPPPGGWNDDYGTAAFNERQNVVLKFDVELEEPIIRSDFALNPIAYVRHDGCFIDALEVNGKLFKPAFATIN